MLPSKNIFKHGENSIIQELSKDYLHGLYFLTKDGKNTRKKFKSLTEASKDKSLEMDDVFTVGTKKYTLGRIAVNNVLPESLRDYDRTLNKKNVRELLSNVGKQTPNKFSQVINSFKDLGNKWSHERGTTLSIHDLKTSTSKRNKLFAFAKKQSKKNPKKVVKEYSKATNTLQKYMEDTLSDSNNFKQMIESGGHGNPSQIRQILYTPGLVNNVKGDIVPYPINTGYAEGLDSFDY